MISKFSITAPNYYLNVGVRLVDEEVGGWYGVIWHDILHSFDSNIHKKLTFCAAE